MNNKNKFRIHGSALPLVMIAVMILLILGASLLNMGVTNRIFSLHNATDITARTAADAGVTEALFEKFYDFATDL